MRSLFFIFALIIPFYCFSQADAPLSTEVDGFTIHHTVFSSTAIPPDIAARQGLKRGKDYVFVNVSLIPAGKICCGSPAQVTGVARNLMQQQKKLDFVEISEPNATYYIAVLRVTEEEVFHFDLAIKPAGTETASTYNIKFTKKLYVNE